MRAGIAFAAVAACTPEVAWFDFDDDPPDSTTVTPPEPDRDGDGWSASEGDCDDTNEYVGPWELEKKYEFAERCDQLDNDCDGEVDVIVSADVHVCARQMTFEQNLMVDLLFVVDTTDPMALYHWSLATGARNILTSLAGEPYLDSHIGTITMDTESESAGELVTFDGESFISGSNVGPGAEHIMAWAEEFVSSTITQNPPSQAAEEGRGSVALGLGLGVGSELLAELNPGFVRDEAHLVVVFLSSNEDQTIDPTVDAFEAELALLKGSLSEVTIHAIVQAGELNCYGESKPAQKGYTYQKLAQDTAGTVLSICQDTTSGFFEAMGQNSAYEGLETEFPLLLQAQAHTVAVTIVDTMGNQRPLDDFALADDNRTLVITADPPPSAGSLIIVDFEMEP